MDQLRRKLYDYTETPPPGVWQEVESALDNELPGVARKLSEYSPAPPAALWNKIESGLGPKKEETKLVPFRRVIRIAAAAVILFAVFMAVRLFTPESSTDQITFVPGPQTTAPASDPKIQQDTQTGAQPVEKINPAITKSYIKTPLPPVTDKQVVSPKKTRYTTMSNDEGQTVRLSKKIAPVFDCAGAKMKAISARCKEDIKALQEKIASSLTSPSADFSGLIDLLQSLENDQQ